MEELRDRRLSDEFSRWLNAEGDKTLGSIIETFGQKSFAFLFVVLLGPSALPVPTGGATQVLEVIAMLLALQLLAGHDKVWLPRRWRAITLAGPTRERFLERLLKLIRWFERRSHPRGRFVFGHRASNAAFGALAMVGTLGAFVAPPFSWLDTLPALGVVLLSLGVLLEDALIAAAGIVVGAGGITLLVLLGRAAVRGVGELALVVSGTRVDLPKTRFLRRGQLLVVGRSSGLETEVTVFRSRREYGRDGESLTFGERADLFVLRHCE